MILLLLILVPICSGLRLSQSENGENLLHSTTISEDDYDDYDDLANICAQGFGNENSCGKARNSAKIIGVEKNETEIKLTMEMELSNCTEKQRLLINEQCKKEKSGTCVCVVKLTTIGAQVQYEFCPGFHSLSDTKSPNLMDIAYPTHLNIAAMACRMYNSSFKLEKIYEGTYGEILNETITYQMRVLAMNMTGTYNDGMIVFEKYECSMEIELEVWGLAARLTRGNCKLESYQKEEHLDGSRISENIENPYIVNYTIDALKRIEIETGKKIVAFFIKAAESQELAYYVWVDVIICINTSSRYCSTKEKCYLTISPNFGQVPEDLKVEALCSAMLEEF